MNEELIKKVTDVVVEKLGVKAEDVTLDSTFVNDLGADSLDRVELVMALEDEFSLEIPDEDWEESFQDKPLTVNAVAEFIKNKLS